MYIVARRGAFSTLDEGGRLAGLAAVRAVHAFAIDPEWRARPGKVVLRARSPSQWARVSRSRTPRRPAAWSRCRRAGGPSAATR